MVYSVWFSSQSRHLCVHCCPPAFLLMPSECSCQAQRGDKKRMALNGIAESRRKMFLIPNILCGSGSSSPSPQKWISSDRLGFFLRRDVDRIQVVLFQYPPCSYQNFRLLMCVVL